jgi:hypothetical protein
MLRHDSVWHRKAGTWTVTTLLLAFSTSCERSPTEFHDRVVVTLAEATTPIMLGDTVHLLGTAQNPTSETIRAGRGCEPGIGFRVTDPSGSSYTLYDGIAFICPGFDSNVPTPGETDSVSWSRWVPETTGTYSVRAALEHREGPPGLSLPVVVLVQ